MVSSRGRDYQDRDHYWHRDVERDWDRDRDRDRDRERDRDERPRRRERDRRFSRSRSPPAASEHARDARRYSPRWRLSSPERGRAEPLDAQQPAEGGYQERNGGGAYAHGQAQPGQGYYDGHQRAWPAGQPDAAAHSYQGGHSYEQQQPHWHAQQQQLPHLHQAAMNGQPGFSLQQQPDAHQPEHHYHGAVQQQEQPPVYAGAEEGYRHHSSAEAGHAQQQHGHPSAYAAEVDAGMQGIMDTSHEPARPGYGPERPEYGAEVPGHAGYGRWGHDGYAEQMQDEPAEGPSHQGHSGRYRDGALQEPSPTVFVKGLPFDCSEDEVREAFEGCPGLLEVRLSINKATGTSKGFGFLEWESVEAAGAMLEAHWHEPIRMDHRVLFMQYSYEPKGGAMGPPLGRDWVCDMCKGINFFRRTECYQCSTRKPAAPQLATLEPEEPSPILKVSGLEPHIRDEQLQEVCAQHGQLLEVRMVRDRFTSAPRGFAFAHFASVADAARAMTALQDCHMEGQSGTLRLSFARDRQPERTSMLASAAAADAMQAGQAMTASYSTWQPREFGAEEPSDEAQAAETPQPGPPGQEGEQAAGSQAPSEGFVYDSSSGYYWDAASGYMYDPKSALYYHSSTQKWYRRDAEANEMKEVDGQEQPAQAAPDASAATSAAQSAIAAANAAVAEVQDRSSLHAPELQSAPAPAQKRGAVIGAKPQLSASGLLAAAQLARDKEAARLKEEEWEKRQAAQAAKKAAQAARRAEQAAKRAAAASAAQAAAQPAPGAAAVVAPAKPSLQGVIRSKIMAQPAGAGPATLGAPAAAPGPKVQGVIRSSGKWSKKT